MDVGATIQSLLALKTISLAISHFSVNFVCRIFKGFRCGCEFELGWISGKVKIELVGQVGFHRSRPKLRIIFVRLLALRKCRYASVRFGPVLGGAACPGPSSRSAAPTWRGPRTRARTPAGWGRIVANRNPCRATKSLLVFSLTPNRSLLHEKHLLYKLRFYKSMSRLFGTVVL